MQKKALALLMAVLMLTALFTGCADNGTGGGASTSSATSAPAASSAAATSAPSTPADPLAPVPSTTKDNFNVSGYPVVDDKITVTSFYQHGPAYGNPEEMSYWTTLEDITNIHIDWHMLPGTDIDTEVELYFAAGDFPDFFHNWMTQDRIQTYGVEGGMLYDMSETMYEFMPNMVSWFDEFPEAKKVITQLDNAVYSLPRIQKASTGARGQMFFRTDYLNEVGLSTPKTIDEFTNALRAIKDANLTQGYAPLLPYSVAHLNAHLEVFMFPAFGDSVDPSFADDGAGKVVFNRISDQYKRYLEYMNMLYTEVLLDNEMFTLDTAVTMSRVKEGKSAFMTYAANLGETDFADGQIHVDCLAPLTSEYAGKQQVQAYDYVTTSGGAITKASKYAEEIMRMLDLNYAREEVVPGSGFDCLSQNLGIYGKDWEWRDAEKTGYRLLIPNDWTDSAWTYKGLYGSWAQHYSAFVVLGTSSDEGIQYAREMGMLTNNIPYAVTRFPNEIMKYTADETQSVANPITDIDSYVTQMRAKFITGVEPLSNWDAYVAEIQKMGLERVLTVKQAAYDRWMSN